MTNGEKLCIDFPNMRYSIFGHRVITTIGIATSFDLDWWNSEYKEPTTKIVVANDCISRQSVIDMTDYQKYINVLRKCAKEHESDMTFTGHIIVSDLCRDTANLLEELEQESVTIPYLMHKEMNIPISECQKAYDIAIEYLRSQVKVKG